MGPPPTITKFNCTWTPRAGRLSFGQFECEQYAAPDFQCVLDGLQAGRHRLPLIVPKISVAGACGNDQIVVRKFAIGELYDASLEVEFLYFPEQNLNVATAAKDPADGRGNFSGDNPPVAT